MMWNRGLFASVAKTALVAGAAAALGSCALVKKLPYVRPRVGPAFTFRVVGEPLANLDTPIAVDLVLVRDRKLLDRLAQLPASEWFAQRAQFPRDLLGEPKMQFISWEWAPGQSIEKPVQAQYSAKGRGAILFARYRTSGQHRVRVDPLKRFTLHLGRETVSVEEWRK